MSNERGIVMKNRRRSGWVVAANCALLIVGLAGRAAAGEETPEKAGEKVGVEGQFVRVAETAEGWVVLAYGTANESVGQEWMLLDVGLTVLPGAKNQKIARDQIKLVTSEGKVIPLPSREEFTKARGPLAALSRRDDMMHASIDYFPASANQPCRIGFFSDPSTPTQAMMYDEVELDTQRACVGRLYFHVPGGIQYGTYNLDVQFANSIVRVPMKIMTKDEAKEFEKEWKEQKQAGHGEHDH